MADQKTSPDGYSQHQREIEETHLQWAKKPLLREAYHSFHREIAGQMVKGPGLTVELGSGIGMIKDTIPHCITTDIFPNPYVDRVEDAYQLSFPDGSVDNLILFDVWHHLEYPGSALNEFSRVISPGGRVILLEPAALSLLGRFVYGLLHHEPIHEPAPMQWTRPENMRPEDLPYYAAQGNAWKLFRRGNLPEAFHRRWHVRACRYFAALNWLAAGGFRKPQLAPTFLGSTLAGLSRLLEKCPDLFATRMLVVMEPR